MNTLVTGVAHEFNNILQAINGYSEYLLSGMKQNERHYEELSNIFEFGQRGAALIRKIMTFSRKTDAHLEFIDLNKRVSEIIKVLRNTIPKMVQIRTDFDPELRSIKADKTQIEQIVLNLAGNAVDAMPDGGELIFETRNAFLDESFCSIHLGISAGNYTLLCITDTGTGMSEEVCKKVFEPFFTTKAVGKGTGLGLSAVFGIARSLSGRVFCYSEKGNGTTFKIYLPAYEKGEVNSVDETESLPAIRGAETILIVDDEDKIRRLSGEVMESLGFSVLLAGSGEQAIEIYRSRSEEIDLVVLDLGMPGMGGFMCLKELISFDPEVKVIIASGYTQVNEIVKNSIREGAAGFISKPYKFADISRKVRTILDASG